MLFRSLVTPYGNQHKTLYNIGTVDYDTGLVQINNLIVNSYLGDSIRIFAKPRYLDFSSSTNTILSIASDEIFITANAVRV